MNDAINDLFADVKQGRDLHEAARDIADFYHVSYDALLNAYNTMQAADERARNETLPTPAFRPSWPSRKKSATTDADVDRAIMNCLKSLIALERARK